MASILTGEQCRMARALLKLSEKELAKNAGVSITVIRRIEATVFPLRIPPVTVSKLNAVHQFFISSGRVLFKDQGVIPLPNNEDKEDKENKVA